MPHWTEFPEHCAKKLSDLEKKRAVLWSYMLLCVEERDLHGVRDACVDIEKLDARIVELNEILRPGT